MTSMGPDDRGRAGIDRRRFPAAATPGRGAARGSARRLLVLALHFCGAVLLLHHASDPRSDGDCRRCGKNLPWLFLGTLAGMVLLESPLRLSRGRSRRAAASSRSPTGVSSRPTSCCSPWPCMSPAPSRRFWAGRIFFFIWVSVYNLFVVSVFWQLNVDLFSPEQGKRLFGFIAVGATLGAALRLLDYRDAGALCIAHLPLDRRRPALGGGGVRGHAPRQAVAEFAPNAE